MSDRALLFDIGNTRLKWGVYDGRRLARTGTVTHDTLRQTGFSALTTRLPRQVERVLACNVAGASFGTRLTGVIHIHCGQDVHYAHTAKAAYGIVNAYRQPRRMGVDRWVAMIGARAESKAALCVVDAGTAVTIDALDRDGHHLGGQILPGLGMMPASLATGTSDIGAPKKTRDPSAAIETFATTTEKAVQNGALNAICGAIERSARILRSAGHRPRVVLTGGDASRILKQLDGNVHHRPHLVLQGLAFMLNADP